MNERERFLKAIEADRYDQQLRFVFADWLEEYGDLPGDENLALWHRTWTRERQEAEDWLHEFAQRVDIPYKDVIDAGHGYVEHGEYLVQYGREDARDAMDEDDTREWFWRAWELVTGATVPDEEREGSPFTCSC